MASLKAIAAIALTLMIAAPIGLGYLFASEDTTSTDWVSENKVNLSNEILNTTYPIFMTSDGVANNTTLKNGIMVYVQTSTTPTSYPMLTVTSTSISFAANTWVDLSAYPSWEIAGSGAIEYQLNGDEEIGYGKSGGDWKIIGNGGSLRFTTAQTLTLNSYTDTGQFADINAGWKLPSTNYKYQWTNYQDNKSVRLLADLPDNSSLKFGPNNGNIRIDRTAGEITITERDPWGDLDLTTETLGDYQYISIDVSIGKYVVSGITSWPGFGSTYQTYNSITVETSGSGLSFTNFSINTTSINTVFRVDYAEISAGSFPSTKNFTLAMDNLFPDKSYTLKFNSIGIYGSSIRIGSHSFIVNSNTITVDGTAVALKGMTITSKNNGTSYDVYINNHKIGTETDPASISFFGDWSLTVTGDILKQVTTTQAQWAPGQFAFDKEDFAACGLLAAGACLIGLGMYGARSGIKMGLLLLICGGAALIYLTFV